MKPPYDPPRKDPPEHLRGCPIHSWRADTGIELVHQEPDRDELERIWRNWLAMPRKMRKASDQKSKELFDMTNKEHYRHLSVPAIIQKEAGVFKPIWGAAKFIAKNPYARRVAVGAGTGALVGGTANMMAGDVGSQGKNFAKGALIGAGVGALAGGAVAGRKAWGAHKAIANTAPKTTGMKGFGINMNKTGSAWKTTKSVGKVVLPLGVVGGGLLYWNNQSEKMGKNAPKPYYETQAPMLPHRYKYR